MEVSAYFTAESLVATGFEAFKVAFKSLIQGFVNFYNANDYKAFTVRYRNLNRI